MLWPACFAARHVRKVRAGTLEQDHEIYRYAGAGHRCIDDSSVGAGNDDGPAGRRAPSACAAFVQSPAAPDGATVTRAQMEAAVAAFEAWRVREQTTLDCRRAEADALNAQATARANEYRAAQADNTARAAAFQAQIAIFQARPERSRR